MIGVPALVIIISCYLRCRRQSNSNSSLSNSEENENQNQSFPLEDKEPKETFAQRLKKIGIDNLADHSIASHFICSITQEIMEDPATANDGHTYERSAIEKQMSVNGNSPLERDIKITSIVPNKNLKGQIIEFVEAQEKLAKENVIITVNETTSDDRESNKAESNSPKFSLRHSYP